MKQVLHALLELITFVNDMDPKNQPAAGQLMHGQMTRIYCFYLADKCASNTWLFYTYLMSK